MVEALLECVEECLDCAVICTACPDHLPQLLPQAAFRFPRTPGTTVDFRLISAAVEFCADACLVCVEQCERHAAGNENCPSCTEACRRCRIACERLAALIG